MRVKKINLKLDVACDDELSRRQVAAALHRLNGLELKAEDGDGKDRKIVLSKFRSLVIDDGDYTDLRLS